MADLVVTAAQVSPIWPRFAEIYPKLAAETITAGQILYQTSSGTFGVADANASGKQQARGVALCGAGTGQAVDVLVRGAVAGFTVAQAYDAQLFLSDTAGAVADAAATMPVPIGRVMGQSDSSVTKVVYFDFDWTIQRS